MKNIISLFLALFVITCFSEFAFAKSDVSETGNTSTLLVNPLYEMRVRNIEVTGSSPTGLNTIQFDIFIQHLNLPESGPFEYAAGEYYFNFNPAIASLGSLTYYIVPGSSEFTNPSAVPVNPEVVGKQLRLYRNPVISAGTGPVISSVYPGTRVVKMKLETSDPTINLLLFELEWRDSTVIDNDPFTKSFAFINGVMTEITSGGTLIIEDEPLPVELSSFKAAVSRNNVVLDWSTANEYGNSGFDIERKIAGTDKWTKAGFVNGYGNSNITVNYSFKDTKLNSGFYNYRLKQIDYNGNYEYFNLKTEVIISRPEKYFLSQNYPNPFNPVTKIDFAIKSDGFVSLKLFDVSGRLVKNLVNEIRTSGYYTIELNTSSASIGLSSGVYYYRLESGSFVSSKKLVLLK